MSVFIVILSVSVAFLALACTAFIWCVRNNQYDDVERNGQDIFFDAVSSRIDVNDES